MDEASELRREKIRISDIRMEEGAEELMKSPDAQPYMRLAIALAADRDLRPVLEEISQLPLEKRYLWRVVSALKWAFVDLDDLSIVVDSKTLSPEEMKKIENLLEKRPLQFCLFMKALYGSDNMERIMNAAVGQAKAAEIATF
jgi:hypothetical protein